MQLQTSKRITGRIKILILSLTVLLSISFTFAQELKYPIKNFNGIECYVYTVKQAEGFYSITKKFNTTEAVINSFNPATKEGLKLGMQLYIPVMPSSDPTISYITHIVEKKQTVFRICKIYKITEDELREYNPQLQNRSVQIGEVLKIPVKKQIEGGSKKLMHTDTKQDNSLSKSTINVLQPKKAETLNIAFLLTFMLDQQHELSDNRFVEFYAGALVAIQKAKSQGINLNIYTFDVEKSDLKLMEVLQDTAFKKIDLIIGPAYSNQVSIISDFARMHKIKTLIPFSSKIYDLETNPYIYQFNPGLDIEQIKLQEILKAKKNTNNIIFADLPSVNNKSDEGFVLSYQLKDYLRKNNINYQTVIFNQEYIQNLQTAIDPTSENLLIFNTSRLNNLQPYLKSMNELAETTTIKIYEPYAWRTSKIKRPQSFYLSAFKNDFKVSSYENYMREFDRIFDWSPTSESPRYDLLGYDLMNYFLKYVLKKNQSPPTSYQMSEEIQSDMKFEKSTDKGGFINKSLNLYE